MQRDTRRFTQQDLIAITSLYLWRCYLSYEPHHEKTCFSHMRTTKVQISYLDSIIPLVSMSKISSLYQASVAEQAGLSLTWSETLKTGFLVTWLIFSRRKLLYLGLHRTNFDLEANSFYKELKCMFLCCQDLWWLLGPFRHSTDWQG